MDVNSVSQAKIHLQLNTHKYDINLCPTMTKVT